MAQIARATDYQIFASFVAFIVSGLCIAVTVVPHDTVMRQDKKNGGTKGVKKLIDDFEIKCKQEKEVEEDSKDNGKPKEGDAQACCGRYRICTLTRTEQTLLEALHWVGERLTCVENSVDIMAQSFQSLDHQVSDLDVLTHKRSSRGQDRMLERGVRVDGLSSLHGGAGVVRV